MRKAFQTGVYLGVFLIVLFVLGITPVDAQLTLRSAVDIDENGRADFIFYRPSEKKWHVYKNGDCSGNCASVHNIKGNLPDDDIITPGDFDGDGKGDFAVWRRTTGWWYWLGSITGTLFEVQFGAAGDEPVARDYDGDGKTDLAFVRRQPGMLVWHVRKSINGQEISTHWGLPTDFAAPGDHDGDGKFDYTIQRIGPMPSAISTFYTLRSSDGAWQVVDLGSGDDRAVPGDYDGDGKTDYAVVREWNTGNANLLWSIRKSTDGGLLQFTYGLTCRNDEPITACDANLVQNDYDGDGKTDPAIWRTTFASETGTFYYLSSDSDYKTSYDFQWGVNYDYPVASYDSH